MEADSDDAGERTKLTSAALVARLMASGLEQPARRFVECLQVPDHLPGLLGVILELEGILAELLKICPDSDARLIRDWVAIVEIIGGWPEVRSQPPINKIPKEDGLGSLREPHKKNLPESPIYVGIWQPCHNASLRPALRVLKAIVIYGVVRHGSERARFIGPMRQLRVLSKADTPLALSLLRVITDDSWRFEEYPAASVVEAFSNTLAAWRNPREVQRFAVLERHLQEALAEGIEPGKRKRKFGRNKGGSEIPGGRYGQDFALEQVNASPERIVVDEERGIEVTLLHLADFGEEDARASVVTRADRWGTAPFENATSFQAVLSRDPSPRSTPSRFRARGAVDAVAMAANHFAFGRRVAKPAEVAALLVRLAAASAHDDVESKYVYAFVLVTLFTGWIGSRVEDFLRDYVTVPVGANDRYDQANGILDIAVPSPQSLEWRKNELAKETLPTTTRLSLPAPSAWAAPLGALKNISPYEGSLEAAVRARIATLNVARNDDGVSLASLRESFLVRLLAQPGSDLVESIHLTGSWSLGDNQYFYTALTARRLQNRYRQVVTELAEMICAEDPELGPALKPQDAFAPGIHIKGAFVGSSFVPRTRVVRELVKGIFRELKKHGGGRGTAGDGSRWHLHGVLEYHDWYTLYTLLFAAYSCGLRGTSHPLADSFDFDPVTAMLLISDKDADDFFSARLVPVCPMFAQQLENYERHLVAMSDYLLLLDLPASRLRKDQPAYPELSRWRDRANEQRASRFPFVFATGLVRGSTGTQAHYEPMPLLRETWKGITRLPINSNRHYLRSHLLARGCHREAIDMFMGHWSTRREPHGRFSVFPMHVIAEMLGPTIQALLKNLGFEPWESAFANHGTLSDRLLPPRGSWHA